MSTVATPDPNTAVDPTLVPEGQFEAGPMWERFSQMAAASEEKPAEKPAEKPVEQAVEEAPPEEVKEESKVEEKKEGELEVPEDFPTKKHATKESVNAWTKLKNELADLKEKQLPAKEKALQQHLIELEEAKKKLAEFEGKDFSQYEKRIKELEERDVENEKFRSIHDVVNSRAFQEEIIRPSEEIGAAVEELAQSYDIDASTLKEAMKIEDPAELRKKLREVTDGWNPMDAAELAGHAKKLREIVSKSQSMIDNADNAKRELKFIEESEAKKKAEAEQIAIRAANEAVEKQINEKFTFLKDHPEVLEQIKSASFEDTPANRALAAKLAPMVTKLNDLYLAEKQRVLQLQEEINKRNQAKPNPSTTVSQPIKEKEQTPGGFDPMEAWARFQSQQSAA